MSTPNPTTTTTPTNTTDRYERPNYRGGDSIAIRRAPGASWERAIYIGKSTVRRAWHLVEILPDAPPITTDMDGYGGPRRVSVSTMRILRALPIDAPAASAPESEPIAP